MKEQSTTRGFAILSAASMLVKVLSLLYIPLLRMIIGDEGYGIYGASYQVYVFIFVLTNSGIPVAISKLVSELAAVRNYKDAVKSFKIARSVLCIIGILMTVILLIFAGPFASIVHYKQAYLSLLTLAPAILFTSVASAYRGYFQGRGNMTPTAVSQVIEQVANTAFSLLFAALLIKYGVEAGCAGGAIGTSIGALISAAFLMFYYERNKKFRVPKEYANEDVRRYNTKQLMRKIIKYGLPITVCVGMTYAGSLVDLSNTKIRLIAGGVNETQANILYGFLTKYQQLLNVPISIISSLSMAILPAISAAVAIKDKSQVKNKINYSFRLCFLIAVPCAVGLAVISDPVYQTLKLGGGAYIMAYGSIVLILMSVMQIQTTILQSIGRLYIATLYSVLGIAFKVITNYFLIAIPKINILGAVVGSIVGFLVPIILNHRIIRKSLGIKLSILVHAIKPLFSSTIMGGSVFAVYYVLGVLLKLSKRGYLINSSITLVAIAVGMLVYMFGLVITRGITKEDLNSMPRKIVRLIPNFILQRVR
ncbi:polysaccharide biosynthesis protein [Clostridiaceae bacterium UIB06]|uniref:Polysaccharide biosynthesis protein n=1 Tax=Clostridium thailandense TaxID=2794346 RepID=A0A949WRS7_9CLOT|nr:polysaccharide biosynthesis protein [Clostridium thailandense]MBV7274311.1 polysaccharide biosynthesis protein [Clostridium thailandense]MCH5136211.1 polysaccharide biosynthesis protein [Clostridiaceae bacterium UIB06]